MFIAQNGSLLIDRPSVAPAKGSPSIYLGDIITLSNLFTVSDPTKRAVTKYQVYDTMTTDGFIIGDQVLAAHSEDKAVTVTSLSSIKLAAGVAGTGGIDTIEVRASNGKSWGDWTSIDISVLVPNLPPQISHSIADQIWTQGQSVQFTVPDNSFSDPDHQALTYSATLAGGAKLPSWLSFDAGSDTFSGTVPANAQSLSLAVTAKDAGGLKVTDVFAVTINSPKAPVGPVLAHQTASQSWASGKLVYLELSSNTFSDPGVTLTYTEKILSGPDVSSWLHFNAPTNAPAGAPIAVFSGFVPPLANGTLKIEIIATDPAGHTAVDIFSAALGLSASGR